MRAARPALQGGHPADYGVAAAAHLPQGYGGRPRLRPPGVRGRFPLLPGCLPALCEPQLSTELAEKRPANNGETNKHFKVKTFFFIPLDIPLGKVKILLKARGLRGMEVFLWI